MRLILNRYETIPPEYLELFCDISGFYEFFCLCFLHVDSIWNQRKAVRADFAAIIGISFLFVSSILCNYFVRLGDAKSVATALIKRSPRNTVELKQIAIDCGFKLP